MAPHNTSSILKMNKNIKVLTLLFLLALTVGCNATYLENRKHDSLDVITFTVGYGAGAKARIGPFNVGLLFNSDKWGLRKGSSFPSVGGTENSMGMGDITCTLLSYEGFGSGPGWDDCARIRGKYYSSKGYAGLTWIKNKKDRVNSIISYYTQLDIVLGLGGSLRLGFNPCEFIDLLLGFTTIDILNDDIKPNEGDIEKNERVDTIEKSD